LLNEDCTIPFIARYRKEMTGNLDEVQIGTIAKLLKELLALSKRKEAILKALEEQSVLTDILKEKINKANTLQEVEDLYLPYKKKRKTKAETARKNGLEPLAKIIMSQNKQDIDSVASQYLNAAILNEDQAIEGAGHIIAEWINENIGVRNALRKLYRRKAVIIATITAKTKKLELGTKEWEKAQKFKDYFAWEEALNRCPSHRLLAIIRAENEGVVKVKITVDPEDAIALIDRKIIKKQSTATIYLEQFIDDAYKRLLAPAIANETLQNAKVKADEKAISVFANNLKQLLLSAPLGEKRVLAIDPGFRTGCKVVCLDAQGNFLKNDTIFPHLSQNEIVIAKEKIKHLVEQFAIEAIAIGDGTASRETENVVKSISFNKQIPIFVVSEAGASIYSASKIAREEFPDFDVTVRGAISIGRRLQDPLAELVKIDPKSIGVGQYQHDVDQTKLKEELETVVSSCVNLVGVNSNTASKYLLTFVSGIGEKLAKKIIQHRKENGAFKNRLEIKKVPRLGAKAFEQSAGFLRIKNGDNPLDNSAVHPESYFVVKKMAKKIGLTEKELIGNKEDLSKLNLNEFITDKIGLPTLQDIVKELEKPGLDPREQAEEFRYDESINTINDLKTGMILPGIVNNITAFGCFVSIGIKESGLIHISNMSDSYVKDPNDFVKLQQQIKVKVLEVDVNRKRIQFALIR
ncbi:MAG TPA: RNA-binding transcriptional accessory protein, partial [Flavobacteriia bacterium]|nr:RNA-binding transcriptional accessory protein [Flavobacteriia bacterium]